MRQIQVLAVIVIAVVALAGCVGVQQTDQAQSAGSAWPLDSLSYIYTDPVAVSPLNDHPLRWAGFMLHPLGVVLDYVFNRPAYAIAAAAPVLTGYTPEDATLQAQRSRGSYR